MIFGMGNILNFQVEETCYQLIPYRFRRVRLSVSISDWPLPRQSENKKFPMAPTLVLHFTKHHFILYLNRLLKDFKILTHIYVAIFIKWPPTESLQVTHKLQTKTFYKCLQLRYYTYIKMGTLNCPEDFTLLEKTSW